jgi:hypothetical protein
MGPLLFSRLLELNDGRAACSIVFKLATTRLAAARPQGSARAAESCRRQGPRKIDLGDYGLSVRLPSPRSSALLTLDNAGGDVLFGEPALDLPTARGLDGRGIVNIPRRRPADSEADAVFDVPALAAVRAVREIAGSAISTLLTPRVLFDEAHLLFDDCPPALQKRVEQTVRLIRPRASACISARRIRTMRQT